MNPLKSTGSVKWTHPAEWGEEGKIYKLRSVVSRIAQSRWDDEMPTKGDKSKQEKGIMTKNIFESAGRAVVRLLSSASKRTRTGTKLLSRTRGKRLII